MRHHIVPLLRTSMDLKQYNNSPSLFQVIPEALLSIFDFQELELFMCGLPRIDIEDWKRNTMYTGALELMKAQHKVAKWWWEVNLIHFLCGACMICQPAQCTDCLARSYWRSLRLSSVRACSSL